ncbi:hypothetical protein TVAG_072130 [Trichomonas vaginalis G3]|uniref:Uncharacterized protein n=1 Tax=Trichomonas vaginalis (strain ATCC PRA-98 / G3) TaxID=412133 RepID=A2D8B7_TRIV3|nr:hypothetical protein TVAGG3_1047350 [Trichomonas vaginalis G3]EAY23550.1 hypothetical protein TVAG_072130 [Trichomonas vaginalis G3]KAI5493972.1 hypothetical protein TVAGG3_1047350 [Trichomonas vaginalis G3]|eukprot:XP_001584536.1 hypothetical protein [Trichomonas vaginalis G3]
MDGTSTQRSKKTIRVTRKVNQNGNPPSKQQKPVTQSEIHELRLKTAQLDQQTKIMRTQLNRVRDQIASKTKAINKTVSSSSDVKGTNGFKTRAEQLEKSIQAATDTKEKLEEQIEQVKENDKGALVVELKEELKMAYCELQRIHDEIEEHKSRGANDAQKLKTANMKLTNEYLQELELKINKTRDSNRDIKDKIIAYYKKIERNNIERSLNKRNKEGIPLQYSKVEIEDNKRYRIEKFNVIAENLNDQSAKFESNVELLNNIINEQRSKIINHLSQDQAIQREIQLETARTEQNQEEEEVNIDF